MAKNIAELEAKIIDLVSNYGFPEVVDEEDGEIIFFALTNDGPEGEEYPVSTAGFDQAGVDGLIADAQELDAELRYYQTYIEGFEVPRTVFVLKAA